jgi:hypothetical protein
MVQSGIVLPELLGVAKSLTVVELGILAAAAAASDPAWHHPERRRLMRRPNPASVR